VIKIIKIGTSKNPKISDGMVIFKTEVKPARNNKNIANPLVIIEKCFITFI
jgi:hypothetical protein